MSTSKLHVCIMLTMLFCVVSPAHGQAGPARFPESRSYSPGKLWLQWTPSERTGFVRGFIVGHGDGYRQACNVSTAISPTPTKAEDFDPCLKKQHLFERDLAYYEKFITDFYTQYSRDQDVPLRVLLLQADQRTIQEVHEWLSKTS
jgi:hypothetical protein